MINFYIPLCCTIESDVSMYVHTRKLLHPTSVMRKGAHLVRSELQHLFPLYILPFFTNVGIQDFCFSQGASVWYQSRSVTIDHLNFLLPWKHQVEEFTREDFQTNNEMICYYGLLNSLKTSLIELLIQKLERQQILQY